MAGNRPVLPRHYLRRIPWCCAGIVDGVPPGIPLTEAEADLQRYLNRRRPGAS